MLDPVADAIIARGGSYGGGGPISLPQDSALRAALGMPQLGTGTPATDILTPSNCTLIERSQVPGLFRILFGRLNQLTGAYTYPTGTLVSSSSKGSLGVPLCTFPKGYVRIRDIRVNLPIVVPTTFTITTPVWSIGSTTAHAGDGNLTTTSGNADHVPSTSIVQSIGGSAIDGTHLSGVLATQNNIPLVPNLIDNSGGTANVGTFSSGVGATIATIGVGVTIPAGVATQNAISTLAAQLNSLAAAVQGLRAPFNGTSTALTLYLNIATNSDPSSGKTVSLGQLATTPGTPGFIDIDYEFMGGLSSSASLYIAPPTQGAGAA